MSLSTDVSITDMFCGAGGSSQGAHALGLTVRMAANHWRLAVDSHNENFPDADHDCADISATDPRRYPTTTILWASPECTNHSQAKGIKKVQHDQASMFDEPLPDEAAERSRATMWDVPRFAEHHRYRYVVVENVVDAKHWVMFDAWLMAMHALGYHHEVVYLNSMHAGSDIARPAPQSRDRMYVVFWQRGETRPNLRISPPAWCEPCGTEVSAVQAWKKLQPWGRYRAQYVYRCPTCHRPVEPYVLPAASAIDWDMPGQRIGDRTKALAPKTIARIEAGLRRYGRPIHVEAGGNQYDSADPKHRQHGSDTGYMRAWPADTEPLRTLHTALTKGLAYPPMLIPAGGTWREGGTPVTAPMPTRTTRDSDGLLVPPMLVPVEGRSGKTAQVVAEPLRTMTTRNETAFVVPPFIAELRGGGSTHRPVSQPLATFTASGLNHGLVQPPDVGAMVMRNNTGGAEMSTPVHEPLRTLTTTGHQSLITWQALYGYDSGLLRHLGQPLPTQTTVQGDGLLTGHGLPDVEDCLFRMLEPAEIGRGMAFHDGYIVLGNKREQVRMYGNAVTPPASTLLLGRVLAALTGSAVAA